MPLTGGSLEGGRWQAVRAGRTRNHRLRLPERDVMHVRVCRCGRAEVSVCSPRVLFVRILFDWPECRERPVEWEQNAH